MIYELIDEDILIANGGNRNRTYSLKKINLRNLRKNQNDSSGVYHAEICLVFGLYLVIKDVKKHIMIQKNRSMYVAVNLAE